MDIQLEAVGKTQKKTAGFTNVTVIQADHAEARWLTQPAQIIVFNLGYLLFFKPLITHPKQRCGTGRRCFPSDAGWLVGAGCYAAMRAAWKNGRPLSAGSRN
ncbi:MAG: class I SAM-dependent methyltransferase [Merdibacter sp.]